MHRPEAMKVVENPNGMEEKTALPGAQRIRDTGAWRPPYRPFGSTWLPVLHRICSMQAMKDGKERNDG